MYKPRYTFVVLLLFCMLPSYKAYASYYPFILQSKPPVCNHCIQPSDTVIVLHHNLIQQLLSSGVFIGDSSSYVIPAGAINIPPVGELIRTLTVEITAQRSILYKELTPYLKEKIEQTSYSITVTVSSGADPQEYVIQKENLTSQQLEQLYVTIAHDIIDFYSSRRIPVLYQTAFAITLTAITLSPVYIDAFKELKDYAHSGSGFQASTCIENTKLPSLVVIPALTWFMLHDPVVTVNYWHSISFMMQAGYRIKLPLSLSCTPFIGAGYTMHIISGDTHHSYPPYSYSQSIYYNPQITAGIILALMLDPQLSLSSSAAYTTYFESSSHSSYFMYTLGFTFHCNWQLYQTMVYH